MTSNNTSETYGKINTSGNVNQTGSFSAGSYSGSAIRPWHSIRNEIKAVVIEPSITQLGREMFTDCNSIESVTLPGTIKNYQWGAFSYCSGLKTVIFEAGTVNLGESKMFIGCENLRQVYVPDTVASIPTNTFDNTFFDQYGNFARNSVVIDCPLTACGTAFNNAVVTNVYFEEISGNALKSSTVINRNSKITNLYLPASATSVHDVFWRWVNNKADGGYVCRDIA